MIKMIYIYIVGLATCFRIYIYIYTIEPPASKRLAAWRFFHHHKEGGNSGAFNRKSNVCELEITIFHGIINYFDEFRLPGPCCRKHFLRTYCRNYGKSPSLMGKSTTNTISMPCSIAFCIPEGSPLNNILVQRCGLSFSSSPLFLEKEYIM